MTVCNSWPTNLTFFGGVRGKFIKKGITLHRLSVVVSQRQRARGTVRDSKGTQRDPERPPGGFCWSFFRTCQSQSKGLCYPFPLIWTQWGWGKGGSWKAETMQWEMPAGRPQPWMLGLWPRDRALGPCFPCTGVGDGLLVTQRKRPFVLQVPRPGRGAEQHTAASACGRIHSHF